MKAPLIKSLLSLGLRQGTTEKLQRLVDYIDEGLPVLLNGLMWNGKYG